MLKRIINKIETANLILNSFQHQQRLTEQKLNDVLALQLMQGLLDKGCQLPVSSSSLKLHSIALIVNDIILNNRRKIVEFGSGISTVIFCRLFHRNNIKAHLYTVEENLEWITALQNILKQEDLLRYVTFIYAPLETSANTLKGTPWFSVARLDEVMSQLSGVDLALVDGPSAWKKEIALSRYPAMAYLYEKLANNYSFYLDDTDREGEQLIIKLWEDKWGLRFEPMSYSLAVAQKGRALNTKF